MAIEWKGLIAGLIAAVVVLGATFGISALVASTTKPLPANVSSPAVALPSAGAGTNLAQIAQGKVFYKASCASCHGPDASGGLGPTLRSERRTDTAIAQIITKGIKGTPMPAFGNKYQDPQVQSLVAYIRSLKK